RVRPLPIVAMEHEHVAVRIDADTRDCAERLPRVRPAADDVVLSALGAWLIVGPRPAEDRNREDRREGAARPTTWIHTTQRHPNPWFRCGRRGCTAPSDGPR